MRTDITINNIEQSLVKRLSQEAESRGIDVNSFLITILSNAIYLKNQAQDAGTLEELGGTWEQGEFEAFTAQTKHFENIDHQLWQ